MDKTHVYSVRPCSWKWRRSTWEFSAVCLLSVVCGPWDLGTSSYGIYYSIWHACSRGVLRIRYERIMGYVYCLNFILLSGKYITKSFRITSESGLELNIVEISIFVSQNITFFQVTCWLCLKIKYLPSTLQTDESICFSSSALCGSGWLSHSKWNSAKYKYLYPNVSAAKVFKKVELYAKYGLPWTDVNRNEIPKVTFSAARIQNFIEYLQCNKAGIWDQTDGWTDMVLIVQLLFIKLREWRKLNVNSGGWK